MTDTITATPVSFRLVGPLLLKKEAEFTAQGYTRKMVIMLCGYKNPTTGKPAYTAFYTAKLEALDYAERISIHREAQANTRYSPLINAIRSRSNYESNGYRLISYVTLSVFNYQRQTLLTIDRQARKVTVFKCEQRRQHKDRINRILTELCGLKLFRKGEDWKVVYPYLEEVAYETGASFDMI